MSPHHTSSALRPVVSYLERTAGFSDADSGAQKLEKLSAALGRSRTAETDVRLIADLLSIGRDDSHTDRDPASRKEQTLEALLHHFEALITRPLLCIFEDVHWIDPSTMELLDHLVDRAQALPVLLLITFRSSFNPPWIGYPHVTYLSISRMNRRNTTAIAESITGGKALPAEVLEQIVHKTDGVPLFIEELTKTVLESGVLVDEGDHYAASGALQSLDIPVTLQDSLMARLDRLGSGKEIAQIGAAIGRDFSYALISAVARWDETALAQALDALVQSELLFRHGAPPHASYSFKPGAGRGLCVALETQAPELSPAHRAIPGAGLSRRGGATARAARAPL